ncbi:uncharacterized protein TNCV_3007981 [Trichonephila clavipes]|nr:uncharacterized protein TNCV_3007981 [Trichonephila clavipes]
MKEDIEDVSSELGNGGYRLHFLDETSRTLFSVRKWNVAKKIKWAGHGVRMDEDHSTTKKVFKAQPIGTRRKSGPNMRWIDDLEKDLLVLKTKNWRTLAGRRLAWKRLLEKVHPLLLSH